jgi:hypothetical protein
MARRPRQKKEPIYADFGSQGGVVLRASDDEVYAISYEALRPFKIAAEKAELERILSAGEPWDAVFVNVILRADTA